MQSDLARSVRLHKRLALTTRARARLRPFDPSLFRLRFIQVYRTTFCKNAIFTKKTLARTGLLQDPGCETWSLLFFSSQSTRTKNNRINHKSMLCHAVCMGQKICPDPSNAGKPKKSDKVETLPISLFLSLSLSLSNTPASQTDTLVIYVLLAALFASRLSANSLAAAGVLTCNIHVSSDLPSSDAVVSLTYLPPAGSTL